MAAGSFVKGIGGRGDVQEAWRALPPTLHDRAVTIAQQRGFEAYFTALVEEMPEPD